jgi:hypothetical protein
MESRGIIYVATRHDLFLEEAFLSAESVRQCCKGISITLFTDRPNHRLCGLGTFDRVERVNGVRDGAVTWALGVLDRLKQLSRTPYRHTLYLDTDTRVLTSDLPELFDQVAAADVAMAKTSLDDSLSRQHFGRPLFNTGVLLYRLNPKTRAWLDQWIVVSEHNLRLARQVPLPPTPGLDHVRDPRLRRKLLGNDQISLARMLTPTMNRTTLTVKMLDYSWNHRGSALPECNQVPIRIRHWPRESHEIHIRELKSAIHSASPSRCIANVQ